MCFRGWTKVVRAELRYVEFLFLAKAPRRKGVWGVPEVFTGFGFWVA